MFLMENNLIVQVTILKHHQQSKISIMQQVQLMGLKIIDIILLYMFFLFLIISVYRFIFLNMERYILETDGLVIIQAVLHGINGYRLLQLQEQELVEEVVLFIQLVFLQTFRLLIMEKLEHFIFKFLMRRVLLQQIDLTQQFQQQELQF